MKNYSFFLAYCTDKVFIIPLEFAKRPRLAVCAIDRNNAKDNGQELHTESSKNFRTLLGKFYAPQNVRRLSPKNNAY
jgi:hypothetical protein